MKFNIFLVSHNFVFSSHIHLVITYYNKLNYLSLTYYINIMKFFQQCTPMSQKNESGFCFETRIYGGAFFSRVNTHRTSRRSY